MKRAVQLAILLALAGLLLWAFKTPELRDLLSLEGLKHSREALAAQVAAEPLRAALIFLAVYVALTAVSFPGATVLTLAGGALFGFGPGVALVALAASLGALLAFLAARYLLRDTIQQRFGARLAPLNEGIRRDGRSYLLSLRLLPVFPFWLVNLLMALTPLSARDFFLVSLVGMLPATAVYVNAGTQLAQLHSASDVLSPALLGSFVLLGLFPFIVKAVMGGLKTRALYAPWPKPKRFDRNLIVIGAGSGGLVTAYIAAAVKAEVTLIEAHQMGGDCLNTGCVPSKALIRSAKVAHELRHAADFGIQAGPAEVDFAAVMQRVRGVVTEIEPHDSGERYRGLGVDVRHGRARLLTPWSVAITAPDGSQQTLTARHIVIATGARPFVPPLPGLEAAGYFTSDTIWSLTERPERLLVLGGGPIGCELAQSFARLGSQVTQVEMAPQLMGREDEEIGSLIAAALRADGVTVLTGHQALRVEVIDGEKRLIVQHAGKELALPFDALLCAVGRTPRVENLGLEALGIPLTARRTVEVNAHLQTRFPNILAVGDVAGPWQFTHTAAHQAWYAAVNALFGRFKTFAVDARVIPWATFTDPEVARVGLSEREAREQGVAVEVTRFELAELDRAICDAGLPHTARGFVNVLTPPGSDRILGVTLVGHHAGELLAEFVLAMKHGLGLNKILGTIHTYPTLAEASKYTAGVWKRAHAPQGVLRWLARFHAWERG
jgi:pyruvate/2-oxoglutarate dehydrogenase complex dihydrolipoamide dehydrogenase (E3) component/uncharacterized membrane protein YdjX (TVP38/TMEM64 family)